MLIGFQRGTSLDGVGDHVGDQAHRGPGREGVGPAGQELLDDVVLGRALERRGVQAVLLGDDDVERQQPGRRRVDRHRRVHRRRAGCRRAARACRPCGRRDADLADLAARELVVGVVAGLGGQVEGDRQPRLALGQVRAVQLVALLGGRMARVGPHHPRAVALGQAVLHGAIVWSAAVSSSPARSTSTTSATRSSSAASSSTASSSTPVRSPRIARCWRRSTTPPAADPADPHPLRPRRRHRARSCAAGPTSRCGSTSAARRTSSTPAG